MLLKDIILLHILAIKKLFASISYIGRQRKMQIYNLSRFKLPKMGVWKTNINNKI